MELRRAIVEECKGGEGSRSVAGDGGFGTGKGVGAAVDSGGRISGGDAASAVDISAAGRGGTAKAESYSWYRAEIINRSITDEVKRDAIRAHLIWLADKLDEDRLDHQLMTFKYELMAGTDASLTTDFKMRAQAIQANKAEIEEES